MPNIDFVPIPIDTASDDQEGRLVMRGSRLVGVLVRLDGLEQAPLQGWWSLEAAFGRLAEESSPEPFETLAAAGAWVRETLESASILRA